MPSRTSRVQEGHPTPPPTPALRGAPSHTHTGMESQQVPLVTTANAPSASTQRKGQEVSDGGHIPPHLHGNLFQHWPWLCRVLQGLQCFRDVRRLNRTSEKMQMLSGYF